jgi:hypothetical protein
MRRATIIAAGVAVIELSVSGLGSASPTTASNRYGSIKVGFKGWGRVVLGKGFLDRQYTPSCMQASCPASAFNLASARGRHGATGARLHWRGVCRNAKRKCTIRLKHAHPDVSGYRHARLTAKFAAAVPGFTRSWPVPLGHTASTDTQDSLHLRVNSVTPSASLTPAAPAGAEYFVAKITATYLGGGSYNDFFNLPTPGCRPSAVMTRYTTPARTDAPMTARRHGSTPLELSYRDSPIPATCWTIAANDAASLELYFAGSAYKTRLALH